MRRQKFVGLLDIGSSKIVCLIVGLEARRGAQGDRGPRVVGIGHRVSRGIKAGVVTDFEQAEEAVRACIDQAETMAGVTLEDVVVALNCGRPKSKRFTATADVTNGLVGEDALARIFRDSHDFAMRDGRPVIHMNPAGFRLDGASGGEDPRGVAARTVQADMHTVSVDGAAVQNLRTLLGRCYLKISGFVLAPFASGLGAVSADDRRLGAACIDVGGGVTSVSVFRAGQLVHADILPVGSDHISFDIARILQTPLAEAERIKALYGTLVKARSDEYDMVSFQLAGEGAGVCDQVSKSQLGQIIEPRVRSMLTQLKGRIDRAGLSSGVCRRFVLTGGGAQLVGLQAYAANLLGASVRLGATTGMSGLPQNLSGPAFSTVAGMLEASVGGNNALLVLQDRELVASGYFSRVGQWLMESL